MRQFIDLVEAATTPSAVVQEIRDRWVEETGLTPQQINSGQCEDFAEDVAARDGEFEALEMTNLFNHDYDGGETSDDATGFDMPLVRRLLPAMRPPAGFSWEQAFEMAPTGTHVWAIHHGTGLSYDIECVEGMANPFELPFFQRMLIKAA